MDKVASSQKTRGGRTCTHYWVIESPSEHNSIGKCKRCGCEQQFVNSFDDLRSAGFMTRSRLAGPGTPVDGLEPH